MWVPQVPPFSLPCCEDGASSSSLSLPHKKPPSISLHEQTPGVWPVVVLQKAKLRGPVWIQLVQSLPQDGHSAKSYCPPPAVFPESPFDPASVIRYFFLSFSFQLSFLRFLSFSFHFSELTCCAVFVSGVQYTRSVIPDVTRCSSWQV